MSTEAEDIYIGKRFDMSLRIIRYLTCAENIPDDELFNLTSTICDIELREENKNIRSLSLVNILKRHRRIQELGLVVFTELEKKKKKGVKRNGKR